MLASKPGPNPGSKSVQLDRTTYAVGALLVVVAIAAWADLLLGSATAMPLTPMGSAGDMSGGTASPVGALLVGGVAYVVAWGVMMAAMMLPSATPMIALYAAIARNRPKAGPRAPSTALFTLVYLLIWVALGIPVYALSLLLLPLAASSDTSRTLIPDGIAAVLVAAGLYQFTPLKRACLRVCRTPLGFLMGNWRDGYWGTLRLAGRHAASCLGCCLALMAVLVAAGAMGLAWVTLIAIVVFAEKILPYGEWTARIAGAALVILGLIVAVQPGLLTFLQGSPM